MKQTFKILALTIIFLPFVHADELPQDMKELAKQRAGLNQKINALFNQEKLHNDPDYKKAQMAKVKAKFNLESNARKNAATKEICERLQAARKKLNASLKTPDKADDQAAMTSINQETESLYRLASSTPDLQPHFKKIRETEAAIRMKKRVLVDQTPKGKPIISEWLKVNQAMTKLNKSQQKK